MKPWLTRAIELLTSSLQPPQHELNELDWKSSLSADTRRLTEHLCAIANYPGGGYLVFGVNNDGSLSGVTVVEMQRQTVEDKTALTDARDRFNKERRPFIWFSPPSQGATEPEGLQFIKIRAPGMGQAVWQWHFTNYGHSPANNLQLHSFIKIGNKPWEPTFGHPKTRAGVPLPPNKIDFAATISSPLNQTDFNSAVAAGKVSIRGVITYIDLAGTPYETDFCLVELNSGVQSYCPGNHIK